MQQDPELSLRSKTMIGVSRMLMYGVMMKMLLVRVPPLCVLLQFLCSCVCEHEERVCVISNREKNHRPLSC